MSLPWLVEVQDASCADVDAEGVDRVGGVTGERPAVGGEGRHQAPNGAVL
jgi:hypothetical protein